MGFNTPLDFTHSEVDQVSYHFIDASVPPQYHRSYSIVITAEAISIIVESYGDVLAQQDWPSSLAQFQDVLALLDKACIRRGQQTQDVGYTGGSSDRITAHRQGEAIFDAYRSSGGGESDFLRGDVAAIKAHFSRLIPNFASFIAT